MLRCKIKEESKLDAIKYLKEGDFTEGTSVSLSHQLHCNLLDTFWCAKFIFIAYLAHLIKRTDSTWMSPSPSFGSF